MSVRSWRSRARDSTAAPDIGAPPPEAGEVRRIIADIWHETFPTLDTLHPFPSCAGVERRLRAFAPRSRDGVRGRPPLRRARLAPGRSCRRLSGGRMLEAAVLHLLRADHSAGSAGHVKRREGSKAEAEDAAEPVSWSGAGGQRPTMWAFCRIRLLASACRDSRSRTLRRLAGPQNLGSVDNQCQQTGKCPERINVYIMVALGNATLDLVFRVLSR